MSASKKSKEEEIKKESKTEVEESQAKKTEEKKEESLEEKLQKLTEEKDKIYGDYLRALAEQENLRKRHAKERQDTLKYSNESFFKELLPVLDSVEKAVAETHKEGDDHEASLKSLQDGFDLIIKQLVQVLEKNGLEAISAKGASYDANLHQAIQTTTSDEVKEATVKEEFMKGYKLNGRLLRASMVSVVLPGEK